jgi:hypothetical protein
LSYFLFRSVFNSGIICHTRPTCQLLSLRAGLARQSAVSTWHHVPCHPRPGCHGATRCAIKARSDRLHCRKPAPEVAGPKPRAPHRSESAASSLSEPATAARSSRASTPLPVMPSRCCLPCIAAPLYFSSKPAAAPHHLLPICAGAHREEPPYHWSFEHLCRRDPLHSEQSPEHPPPLVPFSPGIAAHEPPLPSHPDVGPRRPSKHPPRRRTPPRPCFSIFRIYSNPCKFKNLCRIHLN